MEQSVYTLPLFFLIIHKLIDRNIPPKTEIRIIVFLYLNKKSSIFSTNPDAFSPSANLSAVSRERTTSQHHTEEEKIHSFCYFSQSPQPKFVGRVGHKNIPSNNTQIKPLMKNKLCKKNHKMMMKTNI